MEWYRLSGLSQPLPKAPIAPKRPRPRLRKEPQCLPLSWMEVPQVEVNTNNGRTGSCNPKRSHLDGNHQCETTISQVCRCLPHSSFLMHCLNTFHPFQATLRRVSGGEEHELPFDSCDSPCHGFPRHFPAGSLPWQLRDTLGLTVVAGLQPLLLKLASGEHRLPPGASWLRRSQWVKDLWGSLIQVICLNGW